MVIVHLFRIRIFMKSIHFLCMLLTFSTIVHAQTADSTLTIGQRYTLESSVLQETREVWVHLPDDYHLSTKKYPVIYLLDGEQNFVAMVGIHAFLNRGPVAHFDEVIIVGINNTDRTRDLTPTSAISKRGHATLENSGGGEQFVAFLEKELIPFVGQQFRSSHKKILIGHSFGALLGIHILLNQPELFTDYLLLDPSFWWDDQKLLKASRQLLNNWQGDARVFIGRAGVHDSPAALSKEQAKSLLLDFVEMLKSTAPESMQWHYQNFPAETHGSIFLTGAYYGLKYLFGDK